MKHKQTHCKRGHRLLDRDRRRGCRMCEAWRTRERYRNDPVFREKRLEMARRWRRLQSKEILVPVVWCAEVKTIA